MIPRPDGVYGRSNSSESEAERLHLLERIADGRSQRLLAEAGIGPGWDCAELGAGRGSIARWMSDQVGASGSVLALDLDTSLLEDLKSLDHVTVEQADLTTTALPEDSFDLVHTRNLLMHLPDRDRVLGEAVASLRPGGVLVVEEADGFPAEAATDEVFGRTVRPLTRRWTWARKLPGLLEGLGLTDIRVDLETEMLQGGSDLAAFWRTTLGIARPLLVEADPRIAQADVDHTLRLLKQPSFWTPFMAVVCVTATR